MRLNFHGRLQELYGEGIDIEARSIREAVEGFSRQAPDWPRDMRVAIPGYDTVESLEAAPDEIDLMPALYGGSGKFFNIIVGAAMVVAGTLLIATPFGVPLIVSGAVMALEGVVSLFMKAPKYKSDKDPEASKYVSQSKNTTAAGTPVTLAYGKIQLGGQWLSLQSDSNNLTHGEFPVTPT